MHQVQIHDTYDQKKVGIYLGFEPNTPVGRNGPHDRPALCPGRTGG